MFRDGQDDELLRTSWHQFCDQLKEAGDLVSRDTAPNNPVTRATGMRQLARNVSLALQCELDNCDPRFPELLHYFDPIRKQGGDNTDALYVGSPVNGSDTYRIRGHRGSAAYFAIIVLEEHGATPWGDPDNTRGSELFCHLRCAGDTASTPVGDTNLCR